MKDKVPYYEIVNMFFTGAVFCLALFCLEIEYMTALLEKYACVVARLEKWSVIVTAVLVISMYEVGFILNRLGSLIIGEAFKKKVWPRGEYLGRISEIEEFDPKFKKLNIELVLIRTHIMMFLILGVFALVQKRWYAVGVLVILSVAFILSGRSHNEKMNKIKENFRNQNQ